MLRKTILVFAALIVLASATLVNQCDSDLQFEDTEQIKISNCDKPECLLKQGSTVNIEMKLVPNRDIQSLTNNVQGIINILPIPFIGVDGTNACDNIYNTDGNKIGCPLKKGEQYIYKNSFPILSIYPRISVTVHYALKEGNDRIMCFEVPAKITK
ncbi:Ecdysteroid-regulated 16 kDa protein [Atta colombica]|uniref:Ecdysteroid-regulated 16 kDa protein n=1 Tax=Atta colombica TaxID=520822 RepID=A0A151I4K1_9HYME|nr:PREDICTED: ecdysteroid-regulated 16 kDa protein-like [Atta colombica]KYM84866.1 Ecdysteroid-regulated 16 kDa protein [Atta colombica]